MNEEEISVNSLKKSIEKVGELYPVLENQNGKILDGDHRVQSNPKHQRKLVQTKNRAEEIMVRLHAHHRRIVPQEETRALLVELAQEIEKEGFPKERVTAELYDRVPFSPGYVRRLLPEEYKQPEKVQAGKVAAELVTQKLVSQAKQNLVECERCHVATSEPHDWQGHALCPLHFKSALLNPEAMTGFFNYLKKEANGEVPSGKPKLATPLSLSKWEDRKAHMEVPVSKAEIELGEDLANDALLRPITHQSFTLGPTTTPDWFLPRHNLAIYYDGKVHEGHEDKDEELRDLLKEWYPEIRIVVVTYKDSKKEMLEKIRKMV